MIETAWGKISADSSPDGVRSWHSLVAHSTDVAATLEALLCIGLIRARLERAAGGELSDVTVARLCVLALLHDLGKANRGFWCRQFPRTDPRARDACGHVREAGAVFQDPELVHRAGAALAFEALGQWGHGVKPLLFAALSHHGRPVGSEIGSRDAGRRYAHLWQPTEDYDPLAQLQALGTAMRESYPRAFDPGPQLPESPRFAHLFAGLMMLADWIGSDTRWFPYALGRDENRLEFARTRAHQALAEIGIDLAARGLVRDRDDRGFTDLFGWAPRPIQAAAVPSGDEQLTIIEAETGSGKTEAALWHFYGLFRAGVVDGVYFALPTRVAAVEIHGRVTEAARRMFASALPPPVLAVPGYLKVGETEGIRLPGFQTQWPDEPDRETVAERWAAERPKRFLAAPIAVGTVDQVLLTGLQTGHAHLRAAALSRSLLVVDEVHASDRYMTEVLAQVLSNHLAVGGRALLMSATLGAAARARYCDSPPQSLAEAKRLPYPCITRGQRTEAVASGMAAKVVTVEIQPYIADPAAVAKLALDAVERQATVVVIRNTVSGARAVQRALEDVSPERNWLFAVDGVIALHHSRYARADRHVLDKAVTAAFGKARSVAPRVIVGTQTLEQSLDIDADLMITDLCPMDVLLQRIGRLHRHARPRPQGAEEPRLIVLRPESRDLSPLRRRAVHGLGHFGDGEGIYDDVRIIEVTLGTLERHSRLCIPEMNRELVELATHPDALDEIAKRHGWEDEARLHTGRALAAETISRLHGLDMGRPFDENFTFPGAEEQVRTRLGLDDRVIRLSCPMRSPFGQVVDSLVIPGHLARRLGTLPDIAEATEGTGGFEIVLRDGTIGYDRYGLIIRH